MNEEPDVGKLLVRFCEGLRHNWCMDEIPWHRRETRRQTENTNFNPAAPEGLGLLDKFPIGPQVPRTDRFVAANIGCRRSFRCDFLDLGTPVDPLLTREHSSSHSVAPGPLTQPGTNRRALDQPVEWLTYGEHSGSVASHAHHLN